VTDGTAALKRATEAAQGKDLRLGGGVATIRQYGDCTPGGAPTQMRSPISTQDMKESGG
jgi:hypothetical protein